MKIGKPLILDIFSSRIFLLPRKNIVFGFLVHPNLFTIVTRVINLFILYILYIIRFLALAFFILSYWDEITYYLTLYVIHNISTVYITMQFHWKCIVCNMQYIILFNKYVLIWSYSLLRNFSKLKLYTIYQKTIQNQAVLGSIFMPTTFFKFLNKEQ